ncbi:metallophosphoesterase [Halobaculum rubrum]|uniref:metallophosphoesterase n=1 Tax=Halobaculum rubrum TaxID=2872158 RepID=UPI001CA391F3|nr:metallophosphoesterase [Halobaculum rubrum]QZY00216.1 metallophosphoesterase [Halobaculum rubrum]
MLNAEFRDRGVYLRDADALVVADLHVGRAAASDVAYPLGEASDLSERLRSLLDRFGPTEVVIAGDAVHRFDRVPVADERTLSELLDACRDAGARPVFVRGNHDTALGDVVSGDTPLGDTTRSDTWDGRIHDAYELDASVRDAPVVVRHGHDAPPTEEPAGLYVVGHDHPTIDIEGKRRPCWLYAERAFRGADVLVLPAFTRLAAGVEVNDMSAREFQSPFVTDADALRPIVARADGDAVEFPPLGEFRRLL